MSTDEHYRHDEWGSGDWSRLFDMFSDMVCVADLETATFLKVNRAFVETLGYSEEELLGRPYLDMIHPEDLQDTLDVIDEKLKRGETVLSFDNRYVCRDGSVKWLSWTSHPVPEEGVTYAIARDTTERKGLERDLARKSFQLRERLKEISCLYDVSERLSNMGSDLGETLDWAAGRIPQSLQRPDGTTVEIELDGEVHSSGPGSAGRSRLSREIVVDGVVRGRLSVLAGGEGEEPREPFLGEEETLIGALADALADHVHGREMLRERDIAHARTEQQREQFMAVLSGLPLVVYVVDPDTYEVLFVNRHLREMLGENPEGELCYEALQGLEAPCPFCTIDLLQEKGEHTWDHHNARLDRYLHVYDKLIEWPDGRRVRFECAIDVTDLRRAERRLMHLNDELRRSNRDLQGFAYVASHDLQEPLRMVSSFTQLLARRYGDILDRDGKEFIGYAVDGANRMQELIRGLLSYSRVQTRGGEFRDVDLGSVMDDVRINLSRSMEESGAELEVGPLPVVRADRTQMVQLLQNLVGNALKFRREDAAPRVRVHASREPGSDLWRITVSDNGIGIEEEYRERVFQVFQRLHVRSSYEGTGIGLALCRRIVERHGGGIRVESGEGHGSDFILTLPMAEGCREP